MNIAEEKLNLFREIDQLPEELIIELKNLMAGLRFKKMKSDAAQEKIEVRALWQAGIDSGDSQPLNMNAIREEALRRYSNAMNKNDVTL